MTTQTAAPEQVVLLDPDGEPVGAADKVAVHGDSTPLHLAFSSYLVDPDGRVLMTRRALGKLTWPGVWTNSCCGHPGPGEDPRDAVARRLREELGTRGEDLRPLLPDFRYRAVDASGVVENEVCPVWSVRWVPDAGLTPVADEVAEWAWVPWEDLVAGVRAVPFALSPWCVLQVQQMVERGLRPGS